MKSFIRSVDKCELFTVTVPNIYNDTRVVGRAMVSIHSLVISLMYFISNTGTLIMIFLPDRYFRLFAPVTEQLYFNTVFNFKLLAKFCHEFCPMFVLQGWPFPKIFLKINHYVIINSYIIGEIEVAIYGECNNVLMHLHQVL